VKKKFKDTRVGKFLTKAAPNILKGVSDVVPDAGILKLIGGLISKDEVLTPKDKEEALKLITSNTAKILGIDADYGTLETGKSATLFISEGDALDMRTNILSHAFIDGREISLESHQTTLWKRYNNKYKGE